MPTTEGTAEMSLGAADKAAISMVKDHPKNLHQHGFETACSVRKSREIAMASTIGALQ